MVNRLEAAGMKGGVYFRLHPSDLIKLPTSSEVFKLPHRYAIAYDPARLKFVENKTDNAMAAFLPPGYTVTYSSAYKESGNPKKLPLFAYAACALRDGQIYVAAFRVDNSICHDSRFMDIGIVKKNASIFRRLFPENRLIPHLKECAFSYGCPNAKNFFLKRYEAPLPTSPACNAACAGCISYQPKKRCPITQPRIKFIPTPKELAEIALFHISNAKKAIVSFGQGCEGEPILQADVIEKAIKLIRAETGQGAINMNTNASRPADIARLFDAGLDSMRVSMNSARETYYQRYYKPRGYSFRDVVKSIEIAKKKSGFVSINYLTMPGFTDSLDEYAALRKFLSRHPVDMIQWRNLNYDPVRYFKELKVSVKANEMLGVKEIILSLKKEFPHLKMGYFNPAPPLIGSKTKIFRN